MGERGGEGEDGEEGEGGEDGEEGKVKGKEGRGKGGERAAITLNWQVWLQHIKYNHVYRVGYGTLRDTGTYTTYTPPLCHLELLFPPDKCLTWPALTLLLQIYGRNKRGWGEV